MTLPCQPVLRTVSLGIALYFVSTVATRATTITYNPSLNTLPQSQGFTFTEADPASPAPPSVSGGVLFQGPTTTSGLEFWQRNDVPFNFDNGFTMEVKLKVISSSYDPMGGWRE
jgi:hypothetical protein